MLSILNTIDSGAMVCVIISLGMSAAFLYADPRSQTTRMLAGFLVFVGLSIFFNIAYVRDQDLLTLPWQSRLAPVFTGAAMALGAEWMLRIRRMVPAGQLRTRFGDAQFRLAQLAGLVYLLVGVIFNDLRVSAFVGAGDRHEAFHEPEFWYFAGPLAFGLLCIIDGILITLRRQPDRPEKVRLLGVAASSPLIAMGLILPVPWAAYSSAIGQMVFLLAAVQYHVMQGQRGQFLRRFLSPAVADLVRQQGLDAAMKQQKLPVAAVACDLRGYTPFARERDSAEVIDILQRFYDEVGAAAAEHGATIKDYAGDGVLMLLGAPLPIDNRAQHAVELAACIRRRCEALFQEQGVDLGIGVGIASGPVSVGVIGRQRLEYVAVGQAVNLAARLCQAAAPGSILMDEETRSQLADAQGCSPGESLSLKGIGEAVGTWQWQAG